MNIIYKNIEIIMFFVYRDDDMDGEWEAPMICKCSLGSFWENNLM